MFISKGHGLYHFYKVFGKSKEFRKKTLWYPASRRSHGTRREGRLVHQFDRRATQLDGGIDVLKCENFSERAPSKVSGYACLCY